jgi:cell division protein FtsL
MIIASIILACACIFAYVCFYVVCFSVEKLDNKIDELHKKIDTLIYIAGLSMTE